MNIQQYEGLKGTFNIALNVVKELMQLRFHHYLIIDQNMLVLTSASVN